MFRERERKRERRGAGVGEERTRSGDVGQGKCDVGERYNWS